MKIWNFQHNIFKNNRKPNKKENNSILILIPQFNTPFSRRHNSRVSDYLKFGWLLL